MKYAGVLCLTAALLCGAVSAVSAQSYDTLVAQARNEYQSGKLNDAIVSYSKAIQQRAELPGAYYNREIVYYDLRMMGEAIIDFTKAISLNPDYREAYFNRANAYSLESDYPKSVADYSWLIDLPQKDTPDSQVASVYNNRGVAYFKLKQADKAIADFDSAAKTNPKYSEAFYNRGNVYYDTGKLTEAAADFEKAVSLNPAYRDAYYNLGNVYYRLDDVQKSIADYQKTISIDKTFADAYYNLGLAYIKLSEILKKSQ
ncbi:MAG TPA: tetratricopeptide repeat protein [Spirochaetia bacterium]|nr:tetratricopeptide repeat protein [Spirochaetia bacterium]